MLRRALPMLVCVWLTAACSSGDPNVPTSCQPGEVGTCKGPNDCPGTAVCKADGLDFGPCQCTSDAGSD
ncbi:MAG: hypothetical protein IPM35_07310 [Myxococcales bacterium]|nr:hypothetical protein [Myxococcales bacterium]